MKFLVDLNVWVDIALRPTEFPESLQFFRKYRETGSEFFIPGSGYTTLFYILRIYQSKAVAQEFLLRLEGEGVQVLSFGQREIDLARQLPLADFEDACIAATALRYKCELIVTRDSKDFKRSPVIAKSPRALL